MERAVPALLAALLVVASAGAVVGIAPPGPPTATTPVDGVSGNTTDVLRLETIDASTFDRATLVVTGALDAQSSAMVNAFTRYRVRTAFEAASTPAAKRVVVRNASSWVRTRTAELLETEREARNRYVSGELSARAYLATLGRLQMQATAVERTARAVADLSSRVDADVDLARILPDLQTLQGPIREGLAAAVRGEGASDRTFVAVSTNGFVLAQMSDGIYVRETVRYDNRDAAIGQLGFDRAEQRFNELYPWASAHKDRISMGAVGPDVYVVEYTHTHGYIDAALDASTNQIFREVQRKRLAETPVVAAETTVQNNTTVAVSPTYAGGPLRVNVTNRTGAPMTVPVAVNETAVGTTGEDGTVWAISPAGTYNVTVETPQGPIRVAVTARAGEP
ncbi:MAG: hypothetical protein ABEJ76_04795 [Halanaeroarchaeum sp.]